VNPETNPYIPAAGSRPPVLAGREEELDTSTVALGRLGKGVHARSMILDGVRGVGKTVLLRECGDRRREGLSKTNAIASPKNTQPSPERNVTSHT
jgi:Cdc6-like AAA superfamily ATPase